MYIHEVEKPTELSSQFESATLSETLGQFKVMKSSGNPPHITEILLIRNEEMLPCHIMEKYWKFYMECEEFDFII
ncbi:ankyrin repeat domain-containing protein 31 [Protopterus annectens]|uniref:ankyrin repeat domain-containing protein 31 n=1 Tax=Protopterus annectens TaxID=7888 RepID=UPI001CFAFAB9|nr:ankyrin repeat domain-containing protein 31 [Protopterus annectens]